MIRFINTFSQELIEHLPVAIYAKDPRQDFKFVLWNRKAEEVFGRSREQMIGKTDFDVFEAEQAKTFRVKDIETMDNRLVVDIPLEGVAHAVHGTMWLRTKKLPLFDENGAPFLLLGVSEDVTHEHLMNTKLSESEAQLEGLAENTPGMIYRFVLRQSGESEFIYVSAASKTLFGLEPEQCVGPANAARVLGAIHPEDVEAFTGAAMSSAQNCSAWHWVGRVIGAQGKQTWVNATSRPHVLTNGEVVWDGVFLDVTMQVQTQSLVREQRAQLEAASKLSALGQLAASIAHEINNPVASVKLLSEEISEIIAEPKADLARMKSNATKISLAATRISKIINGLRSFVTRKPDSALVKIDCAQLIGEIIEIAVPRAQSESVTIELDLLSSDLIAECRPVEISQVIMNLISNGLDAVKDCPNALIKVIAEKTASEILIRVQDSGPGIRPEQRENIFDAFFTTKTEGRGTGLGLNVSAKPMANHGGTLSLESSNPTTFLMRIPVVAVLVKETKV